MGKPPARRPIRPTHTPQPKGFVASVRQYSGPLPQPDDLVGYENVLPGAAERLFSMAELEQRHRTMMEQATLVSDQQHRDAVLAAQSANARGIFASDMIGQFLGGAVALGCVAGAIFNVYGHGEWYVTIAFVSLPVAGIVKAVRNLKSPKGTGTK